MMITSIHYSRDVYSSYLKLYIFMMIFKYIYSLYLKSCIFMILKIIYSLYLKLCIFIIFKHISLVYNIEIY